MCEDGVDSTVLAVSEVVTFAGHAHQLIEIVAEPGAEDAPFVGDRRRLVDQRPHEQLTEIRHLIERRPLLGERRSVRRERRPELRHRDERAAQRAQIARHRPADGDAAYQALDVTHGVEGALQPLAQRAVIAQRPYGALAALDRRDVAQREEQPLRQRARSDGGAAAIEVPQERAMPPPLDRGAHELEVSPRRFVEDEVVRGAVLARRHEVQEPAPLRALGVCEDAIQSTARGGVGHPSEARLGGDRLAG